MTGVHPRPRRDALEHEEESTRAEPIEGEPPRRIAADDTARSNPQNQRQVAGAYLDCEVVLEAAQTVGVVMA
jgi:hypothetical protein